MYPVSEEFMSVMKAPTRRVFGRVVIDYTDPYLDQSIEISASEQGAVSYPAQTADGLARPAAKYAALDGAWVLGQDWALAPGPNDGLQMGWWGAQLAGADGAFIPPYPTLTVTFAPRPIHRLRVVGDDKRGERPLDFTVRLYDSADNLLHTEAVYDNTRVDWQKEFAEPITQVAKLELMVTRWSHPGRQCKILEFFTSIQRAYEGADIIGIKLLEEREVSQASLPVGNISANEIEIQLNNEDRTFDAGNTDSPLYGLLKPNRRIRAWLGIEKAGGVQEMVPLGTFWSGDWSAPEDDVVARTTGRDRLELLRETEYVLDGVVPDLSLYDLAVDVLTDAGLTAEEYWVDDELKDYIIPYVALKPQSHREALRKIAEACLGQVYCDRLGVIRVEGTKQILELYEASASENASASYPEQVADRVEMPFAKYAALDGAWVLGQDWALAPGAPEDGQMGWWGSQLAGPGGAFAAPYPVLTLEFFPKAVAAVRVVGDILRGEYPVDFIVTVYGANDAVLSQRAVTGNDQVALDVALPDDPAGAVRMELAITRWSHPGRQAKIVEFIDTAARLQITPQDYFTKNNPAKYSEVANYIVVETEPVGPDGKALDGVTVVAQDKDSIRENGVLRYEFRGNPLVQTEAMAQDIADRLLAGYKEPRRDLELDWRGNPALALGDVVTVTDSREANDYVVVRQEIQFEGALRARLVAKRRG